MIAILFSVMILVESSTTSSPTVEDIACNAFCQSKIESGSCSMSSICEEGSCVGLFWHNSIGAFTLHEFPHKRDTPGGMAHVSCEEAIANGKKTFKRSLDHTDNLISVRSVLRQTDTSDEDSDSLTYSDNYDFSEKDAAINGLFSADLFPLGEVLDLFSHRDVDDVSNVAASGREALRLATYPREAASGREALRLATYPRQPASGREVAFNETPALRLASYPREDNMNEACKTYCRAKTNEDCKSVYCRMFTNECAHFFHFNDDVDIDAFKYIPNLMNDGGRLSSVSCTEAVANMIVPVATLNVCQEICVARIGYSCSESTCDRGFCTYLYVQNRWDPHTGDLLMHYMPHVDSCPGGYAPVMC